MTTTVRRITKRARVAVPAGQTNGTAPKPVMVDIYRVVGSEFCVASADGQKVFRLIKAALDKRHPVVLSFAHVESLTSAFLNAAIGQLLEHYDEPQLRDRLTMRDLAPADQDLLRRVIEGAKLYFKDPQGVEAVRRRVLETV